MQLSKNFSYDEMKCPCGKCDGGQMDQGFVAKLQGVRDLLGRPMKITSGFRCPVHNKAIGGEENSMHMRGRAADISAPSGEEKHDLVSMAMAIKMNGVGVAKSFIHLDNRTEPTIWTY